MNTAELHTIEHLAATFLRNHKEFGPKMIYWGPMGCRKNKESEAVEKAAFSCLKENDIYPEAVAALASIDVKKEEPGLQALSEKLGVPFKTFSSEDVYKRQIENSQIVSEKVR